MHQGVLKSAAAGTEQVLTTATVSMPHFNTNTSGGHWDTKSCAEKKKKKRLVRKLKLVGGIRAAVGAPKASHRSPGQANSACTDNKLMQ